MSPKTTAQNEEIRQQSTTKILDAAFVLIARNGYESTSIAQIAKTAGVSKGLLYNYFASKEELLITLVNNALGEADRTMGGLDMSNSKITLKSIFNLFFDDLVARPDYWKLMTEMMFKIEQFEFVHTIFATKINEYVKFIENLLIDIDIANPEEESRLQAALFDGIAVHYLVMRKDYPIDKTRKYLIKKYCS